MFTSVFTSYVSAAVDCSSDRALRARRRTYRPLWIRSPPSPQSPSSPADVNVSSFHRRVPSSLPSPRSDVESADDVTIFAIGSMMNATAIALRGITPLAQSSPAVLCGYRLVFRGVTGMADIQADDTDGAEFHGVVHRLSSRDLRRLDNIECGYTRRRASVRLYSGVSVAAWVYEMRTPKPQSDVPPSRALPSYTDRRRRRFWRLRRLRARTPRRAVSSASVAPAEISITAEANALTTDAR